MREELTRSLPTPHSDAQQHSRELCDTLKSKIAALPEKEFSFFEYMQFVLYEPALGYYSVGNQKFGQYGDFITAPALSPLFGASIAVQILEILAHLGGDVLELGAGGGELAVAILQAIGDKQAFNYHIIEPSAELRQRQQALLKNRLSEAQYQRVHWFDSLPEQFNGVILANEVMDAFPVERFVQNKTILEMRVDDQLNPVFREASLDLIQRVRNIECNLGHSIPDGYMSEVSPMLKPWLNSLAQCMERGVILLIDYGYPRSEYYNEERSSGTLRCFYQHRAHDDPFLWPGLQDITAHVDFTAVAEITESGELDLLGYASQAAFLLDNQLLELAETRLSAAENQMEHIMLSKQIQTLTLPGEMGERFQVIALGKHYDNSLRGFRTQDLTYRL